MIQGTNIKLKEKVASMIRKVYEDEPDKSMFNTEWTPEMVNHLDYYEIITTDDGVDAGFFGWMEFSKEIFIVVGVLNKHRIELTRKLLEVGKKYMQMAKDGVPNKKVMGLTTPQNKGVHSIANILGIEVCYEFPKGLVKK